MNRKDLLNDFYVTKNYNKLKDILHNSTLSFEKEILARVYLEEKNYKAASEIYKKLGMIYEY